MFEVILLAGCIQSILLATYLLFVSQATGAKSLGILLLVISFHLFLAGNDNHEFFSNHPHLLHITWVLPAMYGPMILVFVQVMTQTLPKKQLVALYFVPFVLILAAQMPFFLSNTAYKLAYISDFGRSVRDDFGWHNQVVAYLHVMYFSIALWYLLNYQRKIVNQHAMEEMRLGWLHQFLKLVILIAIVGLLALYGKQYRWYALQHIYPYHFLGILFLIYWCAFRLIKHPQLFHHVEEPEIKSETSISQSTLNFDQQELADKINQLMKKDKLYLKPGLSLHDLTTLLDSNKQYVSSTINQVFEKSFYDYVNEFRLEEFIRLLNSPESERYTLLGLAFSAGFNSKATFNAVFKKRYGVSPSAYQKEQQELILSPN